MTTPSESPELSPAPKAPGHIARFLGALATLILLRLAIGQIALPLGVLTGANIAFTAIFLAIPVYAVFQASKHAWNATLATACIVGGVVLQVGGTILAQQVLRGQGMGAAILISFSQAGLILWCLGLGAAITLLIKDKNLLIPISIFLVGLDIFLVFAPVGPTKVLMAAAPQILPNVALQIPSAQSAPTSGPVRPFAFVGPADILFMAMFFVALHRFQMKAKETARWLVPTILVYLVLAIFFSALPLLVPIGICVLAVNLREFKLTREEWGSTGIITLISVALAVAAFKMPAPPAEPESSGLSPEQRELAETPAQAPPSPRQ